MHKISIYQVIITLGVIFIQGNNGQLLGNSGQLLGNNGQLLGNNGQLLGTMPLVESVADGIFGTLNILRMGDPNLLFEEDMAKARRGCEMIHAVLKNQTDRLSSIFKVDLVNQIMDSIVQRTSPDKILMCKYLNEGQDEKVRAMIAETNRHREEEMRVRFGLLTVLTDAIRPGTKVTLPELSCYVKRFNDRMVGTQPDVSKALMRSLLQITTVIVDELEKTAGRNPSNCRLPEATSNPSEYKSFLMPILKAVENTVNNTLPIVSNTLPINGNNLPIVGNNLPIIGNTSPNNGNTLPINGNTLPTNGNNLPINGNNLPFNGK